MARFTTIVAVIAAEATELVQAVAADAANVTAVLLDTIDETDPLSRHSAALREAEKRRNVYTLIDFDPMATVVDAWVARLTGEANHLDVESGRVGKMALPEFLFIADDIDDARVHWYHGHLHSYAPRRVVTTEPTPTAIHDRLSHLLSDRLFPPADDVAAAALEYSPTSLSSAGGEGSSLVVPSALR